MCLLGHRLLSSCTYSLTLLWGSLLICQSVSDWEGRWKCCFSVTEMRFKTKCEFRSKHSQGLPEMCLWLSVWAGVACVDGLWFDCVKIWWTICELWTLAFVMPVISSLKYCALLQNRLATIWLCSVWKIQLHISLVTVLHRGFQSASYPSASANQHNTNNVCFKNPKIGCHVFLTS